MLHGFKEPTMPTGIEADADSHWNSDKESPTGNPNGRFPFGSEESPTMLQKHLILIILNSTIIHASFNFSPIGPLSSFQAIAMALGSFLCMHWMVHCSSPQTEGIQSSREACPWHGAHLNSTLSPHAKLTG